VCECEGEGPAASLARRTLARAPHSPHRQTTPARTRPPHYTLSTALHCSPPDRRPVSLTHLAGRPALVGPRRPKRAHLMRASDKRAALKCTLATGWLSLSRFLSATLASRGRSHYCSPSAWANYNPAEMTIRLLVAASAWLLGRRLVLGAWWWPVSGDQGPARMAEGRERERESSTGSERERERDWKLGELPRSSSRSRSSSSSSNSAGINLQSNFYALSPLQLGRVCKCAHLSPALRRRFRAAHNAGLLAVRKLAKWALELS